VDTAPGSDEIPASAGQPSSSAGVPESTRSAADGDVTPAQDEPPAVGDEASRTEPTAGRRSSFHVWLVIGVVALALVAGLGLRADLIVRLASLR
jgi:hypothetical protein